MQDIENDEYQQFLDGEVYYHEVIQKVVVEGTLWKVTDGKPITFLSIGLTKECKSWHFVGARMMQIRHLSDVTKNRALLLYALVSKMTIDLGKFFHLPL